MRFLLVFFSLSSMTQKRKSVVAALSAAKSSFCGYSPRIAIGQRRSISTRTPLTMMPEGPEVRTLVDQLQGGVGMRLCDIRFLSGRYVRHGKPDGFDAFAKTMTPYATEDNDDETTPSAPRIDLIREWNAKGKFIYIRLDDGSKREEKDEDFERSIWITLGMSGRFVSQNVHAEDSTHARWYLELLDTDTHKRKKIFYHDARNFGTLKFCLSAIALQDKLQTLGPDILDSSTTTEDVFLDLVAKQRPEMNVCKFLMNQSKLSGVGNYILSEGLYRAWIDPFASLGEIDRDTQRRLFRQLQAIALESYSGQGLSRKGGSFRDVEGKRGKFEFELQCYGRDVCSRGNPVVKETDGPHGRTIWYVEDQLFLPRILRYGSMPPEEEDEKTDDEEDDLTVKQQYSKQQDGDVTSALSRLLAGLSGRSWKEALASAFQSESFMDLVSFLEDERSRGLIVFPPENEIFSALNLCPLNKVKVVIVGQDPYHRPGQAHGLAFSVRKGVTPPPSLKNIFNEAMADEGILLPRHGNLESWARQGVLLLNTVLTVREGQANSHKNEGWEEITDAIIEILNSQNRRLVFLLWGNPAHNKASGVDESKHCIITTSHPSPLGATKTKSPFLGSKCFSRTNAALRESGQDPIDWNVR